MGGKNSDAITRSYRGTKARDSLDARIGGINFAEPKQKISKCSIVFEDIKASIAECSLP